MEKLVIVLLSAVIEAAGFRFEYVRASFVLRILYSPKSVLLFWEMDITDWFRILYWLAYGAIDRVKNDERDDTPGSVLKDDVVYI